MVLLINGIIVYEHNQNGYGKHQSMCANVLNEVLQYEIDEQFGYDKHERTDSGEEKKNYRNSSTKRKLKTQLGTLNEFKSCGITEKGF